MQGPGKEYSDSGPQCYMENYRLIINPDYTAHIHLPWNEASLTESVFAAAMHRYGFDYFGYMFAFVI